MIWIEDEYGDSQKHNDICGDFEYQCPYCDEWSSVHTTGTFEEEDTFTTRCCGKQVKVEDRVIRMIIEKFEVSEKE